MLLDRRFKMVQYSLDHDVRIRILFGIAISSVLIAPLIRNLVGASAVIIAPSAMTLFFILWWIFDKRVWCFLGINRFFNLPNLNGDWEGIVTTPGINGDEESITTECKLKVTQTLSKISISLETEGSISKTIIAGLTISNPQQIEINFAYEVRSTGPNRITLKERGEGFNSLRLITEKDGKAILKGDYFSDVIYVGRNKPHSGFIKVEKISNDE